MPLLIQMVHAKDFFLGGGGYSRKLAVDVNDILILLNDQFCINGMSC